MAAKIRKGDRVVVLTGRDKGRSGEVIEVRPGDERALVRRVLALMTLDHVDAAHQRAVIVAAHLDHLAGAALVASGDHDHRVALFDFCRHHSTSGASEMIFM